MYKIPITYYYNDASWNRFIIYIQEHDLKSVKQCYPYVSLFLRDERLLYQAIISGTPEILEFLFSQGLTDENENIEACAIYSANLEIIRYLINKGYLFNSEGALLLAEEYNDEHIRQNKETYELIARRYTLRIMQENDYLSWLSNDILNKLLS